MKELTHNLQLTSLKALRIVQVYDVFNLAEDLLARAEKHIFSEQVTDCLLTETEITAELDKVAFLPLSRFLVNLTNVLLVRKKLCYYLEVTVRLRSIQPSFTWSIRILQKQSLKPLRTIF